jgi:hypothetical protein
MPVVQPAELWQETGRFEKMGPELLRIKDRHGRDFVVQPTSEEVVTDIARQELRSYKQLPQNFYQIQTKFRDERRPRFGLMRGREFIMKDAYSFDRDGKLAKTSYQVMAQAYRRIFDRFGLQLPRCGRRQWRHWWRLERRVPGDCRHRRRRHRVLPGPATTRPTWKKPRPWRLRKPGLLPSQAHDLKRHARQEHLSKTWPSLLGLPLATHR